MTVALHPATRDRLLVIAPQNAVRDVLAKQARQRPLVALLTSHGAEPTELEAVIHAFLDHGCEYFVCFGAASEALHDRIDELLVDDGAVGDRTVITTWHDDETPADVAEFFFNIAAAKDRSLLVAVLAENDHELAQALAQQASVRKPKA